MKIYLPDINVWLAFADAAHVHHVKATAWLESVEGGQTSFCRVTQMGFLRLITDRRVMGKSVLTQAQAWDVYSKLRVETGAHLLAEPDSLESRWKAITAKTSSTPGAWTDCYLRAFCDTAGLTMVTFDQAFPVSNESQTVILR